MRPVISLKRPQQNFAHTASGVRSRRNAGLRFQAAFLDFATQIIYPSRHADGRLAPYHLLDGLPDNVVVDRAFGGRVVAVKASLIAGFVRNGFFYTRRAAARAVAQWAGRDEFKD